MIIMCLINVIFATYEVDYAEILMHDYSTLCYCLVPLVLQVLFPLIDGTACVNEAKLRHVDGAITADFKGCCNDSALVCFSLLSTSGVVCLWLSSF